MTTPMDRGGRGRGWALGLALLAASAGACRRDDPELVIDPTARLATGPPPRGREVRFAIGAMISPRETLRMYDGLAGYLGRRIGHPVTIVQKRTYAETNDLLVRGEVDFAFVCTGAFAEARARGVELLAVPVIRGQRTYRSLVIVPADSPARRVEDLRGATAAVVDPLSLTGKLYLDALTAPYGGTGSFLGPVVLTHAHSTSIDMVATRRVQVAAVDSLVWDDLGEREPGRVRGVRVLHRSPEFGMPPFVTRPGLPDAVKQPLRKALFGMRADADGARVLDELRFDTFDLADDAAYAALGRLRLDAAAASQRAAVVKPPR